MKKNNESEVAQLSLTLRDPSIKKLREAHIALCNGIEN